MGVDLLEFVHEHALVILRVHAQGLTVQLGCRPGKCVQEHASIALECLTAFPIDVFANVVQDCTQFICLHASVLGFPVRVHRIGVSSEVASVRR